MVSETCILIVGSLEQFRPVGMTVPLTVDSGKAGTVDSGWYL